MSLEVGHSNIVKLTKCCYHLNKDLTRGYKYTDSNEENPTG